MITSKVVQASLSYKNFEASYDSIVKGAYILQSLSMSQCHIYGSESGAKILLPKTLKLESVSFEKSGPDFSQVIDLTLVIEDSTELNSSRISFNDG